MIILPIQSLFVPSYALQGEDIPAHIIWSNLNFEYIRIELPEILATTELYNIQEEMVETHGRTLIIRKTAIEVDGYLGMLFSSGRVERPSIKSWIVFSFIGQDDTTILEERREIHLFRPYLEIVEVPTEIRIDLEKKFVFNRIKVKKSGGGTLLLKIRTLPDSDLQIRTPYSMVEYRKRLIQNLQQEYSELNEKYPQYRDFLEQHILIVESGWNRDEDLMIMRKLTNRLVEIFLENEEFNEKLRIALGNALWRSLRFLSIPEAFLRYLESIASKKIWLARPENVISVSPQLNCLNLEIMLSDLLLDPHKTIRLPSIKVKGTEEGEVEVMRLFEWV